MGIFQPKMQVDNHTVADLELVKKARSTDYRPLAAKLEELASEGSWYRRNRLMRVTSDAGEWNTGWLDRWERECPEDAEPALLRSEILIAQAWSVRSGRVAAEVSREQFLQFHGMLEKAGAHLDEVKTRFPRDPSTWVSPVSHAMGLQLSFDDEQALVRQAAQSVGDGFTWRYRICDAWSAWWGGSLELSWNFALDSMRTYPGSRNALFPLFAAARDISREPTDENLQMLAVAWPWALDYAKNAPTEFDQITAVNESIVNLCRADLEKYYAAPFFKLARNRVDSKIWHGIFDENVPAEKLFNSIRKQAG